MWSGKVLGISILEQQIFEQAAGEMDKQTVAEKYEDLFGAATRFEKGWELSFD